jgi:hypothetical protein
MALTESGIFGGFPTVEECSAHPTKNRRWGCDAISQVIADGKKRTWVEHPCVPSKRIGGVTFEIYRHPSLIYGDTERLWKQVYKTRTKYGCGNMNPEEEFHPCYFYAEEIYENFINGAENAK